MTHQPIQTASTSSLSAPVSTITATLDQPPTPGNLLVLFFSQRGDSTPEVPVGYASTINSAARAQMFHRIVQEGDSRNCTVNLISDAECSLTAIEFDGPFDAADLVIATDAVFNTGTDKLTMTLPGELSHAPTVVVTGFALHGTRTALNTWTNGFTQRSAIYASSSQTVGSRTYATDDVPATVSTEESWNSPISTRGVIAAFRAMEEEIEVPDSTISGVVRLYGSLQSDVRVYLVDTSSHMIEATTTTDANGEYEFVSVPPGTYDLFYRHRDDDDWVQGVLSVEVGL